MIKIGTNFSYKGPLFLDSRHGIAQNLNDLREWSIPIPDGFEVYLNLETDPAWYTYNSGNEVDPNTGKFRRRIDEAWVENRITEVNTNILNINTEITNIWEAIEGIQIQPNLTLEVTSNGGIRLPGSSIVPNINWVVKNYGVPVDYSDISEFTVDGILYEPSSPWNNNGQAIESDKSYTISVTYLEQTLTNIVSYIFRDYDWTKYFGTSSLPELRSITDLQYSSPIQGWGTPSVEYIGTADCSGGKYPYYVIPASLYNATATFKMYVGGFRTTDFVVSDLEISGNRFKTIRTGYIQTGILQIRYE